MELISLKYFSADSSESALFYAKTLRYLAVTEKLGDDYVNAEIEKLSRSVVDYTFDSSLFESVRKEIGDALDSYLS